MEINDIDNPAFYPIIESGNFINPGKIIGLASNSSLVIGNSAGGLTSLAASDGLLQYDSGLSYTMAPAVNSIGKPESVQMNLGSNSNVNSVSFGNSTNTASNSVIMGTGGILSVNQTSNLPPSILVKDFSSSSNFLQYSSNVISLSCKSLLNSAQTIELPASTIFIPFNIVIVVLTPGSGTVVIQGHPISITTSEQYYCYVANLPTTVYSGSFNINAFGDLRVKVVINGSLLQLD